MLDPTPDWVFDDHDRSLMRLALAEAQAASEAGEVPVGAVVADAAGAVVACAANRRERDADPTAHAEVLAVRAAARARGDWRLDGCSVYVTLEPCAMCAAALVEARVAVVTVAAADAAAGFAGSRANLLDSPLLGRRVAVRSGLLAHEAEQLLARFFAKLRDRG